MYKVRFGILGFHIEHLLDNWESQRPKALAHTVDIAVCRGPGSSIFLGFDVF